MRHLLYNRILPVLTFVPIVFGLIGYVLSRITDMTIVMWELVMLVSILLCVGVVLVTKIPYITTQPEHNPREMSWWFMSALIALPMLVMLPGLWALLTDTGVQAITHTDFHASLINQIIHGTFPPVNPQIPDLPIGYYWCEVGKRMGIKDLPETYEQFEQFNRNYEQKYYHFDPANRRVADGTIEIMMSWYPSFLHPIVRETIYALIDEPLRQAFGYRKANPVTRWVVPMGLQILAQIVKRMPPRKTPYLLTRIPTPSHPNGYEIEQLGPPSDHSARTQGM